MELIMKVLAYAAVIISASSVLLVPKAGCQTDAEKVIRKLPYSITSPGEYTLAKDLTMGTDNTGITVTDTANVVIDLNGHTLANTSDAGIGITVESSDFVTIRNGTIYGFGYGLKLESNSENVVIRKVTLANEALGVDIAADKCTVEGCFMSGTGAGSGIALEAGATGVLAKNNQIDGFSYGIQSVTGSESKYNYNQLNRCNVGLYISSQDEHEADVFTGCVVDVQQGN
jgi:hypothetical protein